MPFKFKRIEIALGSYIEYNSKIERELGWQRNQIEKKTGIKKRYISNAKQTTEKLAIKSLKKLAKKTSLSGVRYIISVTNTPSIQFPSLAHRIFSICKFHKDTFCIGLNSGCSGYVDALIIANKFLKRNGGDIIIVTADTYSKKIKKDNRSIRPLFSDGASCTLLTFSKNGWEIVEEKYSIKKGTTNYLSLKNDTSNKMENITMDGPEVLSFGISEVIPAISSILKNTKGRCVLFAHQAGKIMIDVIKNKLNKKIIFPTNYEKYGNLVSTSIPNLIKEYFSLLNKCDSAILSGFGVGLAQSHIKIKKK